MRTLKRKPRPGTRKPNDTIQISRAFHKVMEIVRECLTEIHKVNRKLNLLRRKLDTLLDPSSTVSKKQLRELDRESDKLKDKSDLLQEAIEENKPEGE